MHRHGGHIPKVHGFIGAPPYITNYPPDAQYPRNLAIGHFIRADRNEIAAGTAEGDIVVFAYEHGALNEVSRTQTELWYVDICAGNFRGLGLTDIFAVGIGNWGENQPKPRIFYGTEGTASAEASTRGPVRQRAVAPRSSDKTVMRVRLQNSWSARSRSA